MKRFMSLSAMIILLFVVNAVAGPKLRFDCGKAYEFGLVKPSQSPLHAEIKLYNDGDELLKIEKVTPTCGCTTESLDKKEIKPGDFATLKILLNVKKYNGKIVKSVIITTNEIEPPKTTLYLKAHVYNAITFFPGRSLRFGNIKVGAVSVAKLVLTNKSNKDIILSDIKMNSAFITVNIKEGDIIPAKGDLTLAATVKPEFAGPISMRLRMKTSDPDTPSLDISGWGSAVPASGN
ncbi:MAG: DUF1573 domain-containing protein [Chlorobi bacterium]|nr:DUF1573 domain-containing protein [Chlorobiota bacterium]